MEIASTKAMEIQEQTSEEIQILSELDLAVVGGGQGDITLG